MRCLMASLAVSIVAIGCAGSDALYDPPGGKGFWARRSEIATGTTSFYRLAATFASSSDRLLIYAEAKNTIAKSFIDSFTSAFENKIAPIENGSYQNPPDVDKNKKIILLLLDIEDGATPGGAYIAGYFDPINQFTDSSVSAANDEYHSNFAEMVYIDYNPAYLALPGYLTNLQSTLAHEYQHLLQFGKYLDSADLDIEPRWTDEGLAEISSDLTGFGPQTGRANNFRSALVSSTPLIDIESKPFLLDSYASAYVYFRFLADAYGIQGISQIFREDSVGYVGVDNALKRIDPNLPASCGNSAGLLYPHFSCSYRMMWASLINGNIGDSPAGATVYYNSTSSSTITGSTSFSYKTLPATISYGKELTESLSAGAFTVAGNPNSGALLSYAPRLYKINGNAPLPNFSTCASCGLTMIVGSAYFAVFNHDYVQGTTRAATLVDQINGEVNASFSLPLNIPDPNAPLHERALHWHFNIPKKMRPQLRIE